MSFFFKGQKEEAALGFLVNYKTDEGKMEVRKQLISGTDKELSEEGKARIVMFA